MAKTKTSFFCKSCGSEYSKWMGKCSACGEWNTISEEVIHIDDQPKWKAKDEKRVKRGVVSVENISALEQERILFNDNELTRVLGGGLVKGSIVLLGGEPGIGKSTLLLQLALKTIGIKVLYVSGEESEKQIGMRAERIGIENKECFILNETRTDEIFNCLSELSVDMVIIDSIQTLQSSKIDSTAGSVSQIRESAADLQRFAKETNIPVFIVGHITKDGTIAGPKLLEHMVDTVLQFEGDRNHGYRLLRSNKNRFGSTSELGIYEMQSNGMREVANPSEILISQRDEPSSGVAICSSMEGGRSLLIEIQALCSTAVFGTPQRNATGYDTKRLNMLLAVLEKRAGFKLGMKDVFINVTGGLRLSDPAVDLGIVCAVLSSNYDKPISDKICFAAEIGLTGEVRSVPFIDQRIKEADKLGFDKIFVSKYSIKSIDTKNYKIKVMGCSKIEEVLRELFKS